MTIAAGNRIPDLEITTVGPDGPRRVGSLELLGTGTVVLFGVPGAFTPTCSDHHLPGFVLRSEDLAAKGVDTVACVSVNDAFVMGAWSEAQHVGDQVVMIADGAADLTRALGLEVDLSAAGLGLRSRRYAAILHDGVVADLSVEEGPALEVSTADAVLAKL